MENLSQPSPGSEGPLDDGGASGPSQPAPPYNFTSFAIVGLFVLASGYTLYFAKPVLLPIVLALLVSFALAPVVRALSRLGLPAPLGAALVLGGLVVAAGASLYHLAKPAAMWLERAPYELRQISQAVANLRAPMDRVTKAADQAQELADVTDEDDESVEVSIKQPALGDMLVSNTQEALFGGVIVLVLVYFLLASGDTHLKKLVRAAPRLRHKRAVVTVARGVEQQVSAYLFGFTLNNAVLGCAVSLALYYLDMPNPALWGVVAAMMNFIPYAGALITAGILALAAMSAFGDVSKVLTVTGVFLALTTLEGTLMQPIILGRRLELNPVAILISVIIWGWLWGIPGALLAVPLLAFLKILFDAVEQLAPIGEMLGRH